MKEFTGGVMTSGDHVKINLSIKGGISQSRVYDSNVQLSIDKLSIINQALSKVPLEDLNDVDFYINQLIDLFKSTDIELLPLIGQYQVTHNITVLSVYIKSCINSFTVDEAIQLLQCDRMRSELNNDCNNQLTWNLHPLSRQFIDEITETNDENMVVSTRQLRNLVNQYVALIETKKDKIEKAYQNIISDINKQLSS